VTEEQLTRAASFALAGLMLAGWTLRGVAKWLDYQSTVKPKLSRSETAAIRWPGGER
jgi:hypothetical protein